jgi:alpha-L-rhamnosidase
MEMPPNNEEVAMKHSFNPRTHWIWAPEAASIPDYNWWMFRRTLTLPTDYREAQVRITAAFHYLLYINDTLVTRGPARSYNFRKAYDTVDIQTYLRPGEETDHE